MNAIVNVIVIVIVNVIALSPSSALASPSWSATITFTDARSPLLVDWTAHDLPAATHAVCLDMAGAGRFVRDLRRENRPLAADPDDEDCFPLATTGDVTLRYRYDLAALADARGDPDLAARFDDTFVFSDRAVLLRPDPLPERAPIDVAFRLPPSVSVAAPWRRDGDRFRLDAEQYDAGAYLAVGKVASLGEVAVPGGGATLALVERPFRATRPALARWVQSALAEVARFYRAVPGGRVEVILVPVDDDDPGVFGTTLRAGLPSVVLLFGARAGDAAFADEWVAPHELFHLGNPRLAKRLPWFTEGFTTYYESVLRGRRNPQTAAARWADVARMVAKHCQPSRGASLSDESRSMRASGRYLRVYWGGACLALRLDVAIRRRGAGSLDDTMRELRARSAGHPLDEDEIVAALDKAAGAPLSRSHLDEKRAIPVGELLRALGAGEKGLRDDAPLAALRKAIF